jgi:hypothetical protein
MGSSQVRAAVELISSSQVRTLSGAPRRKKIRATPTVEFNYKINKSGPLSLTHEGAKIHAGGN